MGIGTPAANNISTPQEGTFNLNLNSTMKTTVFHKPFKTKKLKLIYKFDGMFKNVPSSLAVRGTN